MIIFYYVYFQNENWIVISDYYDKIVYEISYLLT